MKKIYLIHSGSYDYEKELYNPIEKSELAKKYEFIFPERGKEINSKRRIKDSFAIIAEVSQHKIGVGIEIGWADSFNIPLICIYKEGSTPSGSLKFICDKFIEYENSEEIADKLKKELEELENDRT